MTVYAADAPRGNNPAGSGSMEFALWILADSMSNLNHNIIHGGHGRGRQSPHCASLEEVGWTKTQVKYSSTSGREYHWSGCSDISNSAMGATRRPETRIIGPKWLR